jgi:hypothetical protein
MSPFKIIKGHSLQQDGAAAVEEVIAQWSSEQRAEIQFLLLYYSTQQSAESVAAALNTHFPNTPSAGCSTAGEFLNSQRLEGSLVMIGVCSPDIRWQVGVIDALQQFDPLQTRGLLEQLAGGFGKKLDQLQPQHHFALVLQDGLSMMEEMVTAALASELGEVSLLGGSAGDDLQFRQTTQIANGVPYSNAAVVVLVESDLPFAIIKDQHYEPSEEMVVVTDAEINERRVRTLDARPAAEVYAEMVGVPYSELGEFDFGRSPLIYSEQGDHYVRSIQQIEEDGSLIFYCAIEEGMLLELGRRTHPLESLQSSLKSLEHTLGQVDLLLLFSCILCKTETNILSERQEWGKILHQSAANVIGFDTYGEQLNGLHINQTLVAVGFCGTPR